MNERQQLTKRDYFVNIGYGNSQVLYYICFPKKIVVTLPDSNASLEKTSYEALL